MSIFTEKTQLAAHRQLFPGLANKAYFNYGGQGPMPRASLDAIVQAYDYIQKSGPFSNGMNAWIVHESNLTREAIASELGAPVQSIALTEDVTVGCNIALWGIDWQSGDRLLLTDCEHPGIVAAAQQIGRRFDVEVDICPLLATLNEGNPASAIASHLHPNTRLVVLSHILWNTGHVLPLAEIVELCRQHNGSKPLLTLVDAAQSVGLLPLNLTELGVDFYAFTGHKWWCGPEGIGGLYIRPEISESLTPTFVGWRSIVNDDEGKLVGWKADARRYEVATSAYPLYAGLRSAIATHQQLGTASERYQQILEKSKYLWQRLSELPNINCLRTSPPEAGLVSFELSEQKKHSALVNFLEQQGFMLRTILNPNCVRACVHYFTLESEIEQLLKAIVDFGV